MNKKGDLPKKLKRNYMNKRKGLNAAVRRAVMRFLFSFLF
jgi:hypothetical protein